MPRGAPDALRPGSSAFSGPALSQAREAEVHRRGGVGEQLLTTCCVQPGADDSPA